MRREKYWKFAKYCGEKERSVGEQEGEHYTSQKLQLTIVKEENGFFDVSIRAIDHVGVFSIPDNGILIVQPKIEAASFLQMLRYVTEGISLQGTIVRQIKKDEGFIEFFLSYYVRSVHDLLARFKRKAYRRVQKDLTFVKGKINYFRSSNCSCSNKINCTYYEFSEDTLIHQTLKYTLLLMEHAINNLDEEIIPEFKRALELLHHVDIRKFRPSLVNSIVLNKLTQPYLEVIEFSRMILEDNTFGLEFGNTIAPAFCFSSSVMFEKFIRGVLRTHLPQGLRLIKKRFSRPNCDIEPDIVLQRIRSGRYSLVIDVKYKKEFHKDDYRQIYEYKNELDKINNIQGEEGIFGLIIYPVDPLHKPHCQDFFFESFDFHKWSIGAEKYLSEFSRYILAYYKP